MGSAGEVGRHAFDQRGPGRREGGADRAPRPLDHRLAPREADRALLGRAQPVAGDRLDVAGVVGERQDLVAGRLGLADIELGPGLDEGAQAPVLGRGEGVTRRQRERLPVGVERLHPRDRTRRPAANLGRARK